MTVQKALEVIIDHDCETEGDVSEEGPFELISDSNDSDFEPNEGIVIPIPPSRSYISKR